jgi:hypothetical protein
LPELESEVKKWIKDHRNNDISVSMKMITCEVRRWLVTHSINDFTGTAACYHFMKQKYWSFINLLSVLDRTCLKLSQSDNTDKVTLTFNVPSNRTVDNKGAITITIKTPGQEKTHYIAVLACYVDGTKLLPVLIFKRKTETNDKIT